ncbi:hypothetical protein FD755_016931, partial [Muntiacus reevesi]
QFLLRLHEEKVIKDRRHHLKTYPNCFVAKELIDWLIEHKEASDRETAIKLMQKLADRGIIHHGERGGRRAALLPPLSSARLMSPENTLLQPREEEGVKYERTFMASEFLDWLVQEGEATAREEAEQLCRRLLEHGIIQHVSPSKEIKVAAAARRSSMSSGGSSGYFSSSPTLSNSPPVLCNPKSVLKRPVTSEELLTPGAPYARKTFTIVGDAVGWGFVVRGSKPCHIQAVDPSGPAAAAGMK